MIWKQLTDEEKDHHVPLGNSLKGLYFCRGICGGDTSAHANYDIMKMFKGGIR